MMPTCCEPGCRKTAVKVVGGVINKEDSMRVGRNIYDEMCMCEKHAKKFFKKYKGGEE